MVQSIYYNNSAMVLFKTGFNKIFNFKEKGLF